MSLPRGSHRITLPQLGLGLVAVAAVAVAVLLNAPNAGDPAEGASGVGTSSSLIDPGGASASPAAPGPSGGKVDGVPAPAAAVVSGPSPVGPGKVAERVSAADERLPSVRQQAPVAPPDRGGSGLSGAGLGGTGVSDAGPGVAGAGEIGVGDAAGTASDGAPDLGGVVAGVVSAVAQNPRTAAPAPAPLGPPRPATPSPPQRLADVEVDVRLPAVAIALPNCLINC
ncbi:hypothetical protein [Candidatus Frankia nodulisporulans]|uniref:hypothetical protein n=1 Tax=Candidatus Frankia nodulisporulans TaxID=2060052 RepID=UPI0013D7712D|nr:hypothetical protein [Candidatus Frankia nodulisporulans]